MIVTRKSLSRRAVLRGLGTAIPLPFMHAMIPAMAAPRHSATSSAVRMGFMYVPNGIINLNGEWTPKGEGRDFEFSQTMQALEPFREHLTVLSGLAQLNGRPGGDGAGDHARAGATFLTGTRPIKTEGQGIRAGVSADQIAARELGKHTQLASLETGIEEPSVAGGCDSGYSCAYTNTISWRTPTTPNPVEDNPRRLFERLFGDGDSTDATERLAGLREQRTILDFVREDLSRLKVGLGPSDKRKLEEYVESVRDLERRIGMAEMQVEQDIPKVERPGGIPVSFTEHVKLMIDLQVLAFQADLTRVTSFMMGREGTYRSYPEIGVPDAHHAMTHHQNDPEKIAKAIMINKHHVAMFAYMLEKMRSIEDGDGTLLDNSMLVYGSSINDGNRHTHHDLPLVLAGGGAGQLQGGHHLRYPSETPMNNLLLSLLDKVGVPTEQLGDSTGKLEGLS
jgi:hypothetical protein